ncbi:hypothetical protein JCM10450v2_004026 [Rhodotorula kratochvilovae]
MDPSTQLVLALVALPASSLPSTLALPAVADPLCALVAHSAANREHRHLLHALFARAAPVKGALASLRLVAHYLAAFLPANAHLARHVAHEALSSNARLAQSIRTDGLNALRIALDPLPREGDYTAAATLLALVQGTAECFAPTATAAATAAKDLVDLLAASYAHLAAADSPALDALRLAIVDTAHTLLLTVSSALSASPSSATTPLDTLRDLLTALLPRGQPPSPLAHDLALLSHGALPAALADALTGAVGPTARQVKDMIGAFRRAAPAEGASDIGQEWLERLRRARTVGGAADAQVGLGVDKGEQVALAGVEGAQGADAEKEAELASAISHLLDLFPHLPPPFLRAALLHPSFSSSGGGGLERATEALVAALLDDAPLPAELASLRDGAPAPAPAPVAARKPTARANVHDDDALFTRGVLLPGKAARRAAPSSSSSAGGGTGVQLDEALKASIIALAEAPSSDEEDEDEGEAFLEGEEDGGPRVKVGDGEPKDGEGSSDDEEEDGPQGGATTASSSAPPARAGGYAPGVQLALESAYLAQPEVFARDGATRRGKARRALRERTGLGDEQIEGWRVMLEREPKKMQRLRDKHQDLSASSNGPSAPPSAASSAPASASGHATPPHQQQRGEGQAPRGGGGTGRGGARGGGASRGRGDGGRREHDRAKRGRDKKLARMGAV